MLQIIELFDYCYMIFIKWIFPKSFPLGLGVPSQKVNPLVVEDI